MPYADGGSLAELHEVAGEITREDTPEGVRVRALVPARLAERFARFAVASLELCLAVVAAAGEHAAALAREQLLEVRLGDLVEVELELAGQLRHVPEHVAELLGHRRAALRR